MISETKYYGYYSGFPDEEVIITLSSGKGIPDDFFQHRNNGPAEINFYPDGTVESEIWFVHGIMNNTEGPAYIEYHSNGTIARMQFWYDEWIPNHIPYKCFNDKGVLVEEEYTLMLKYENCFTSRKDGAARTIFDPKTGIAIYKEYSYTPTNQDYFEAEFEYHCFMYDNNRIHKRKTKTSEFDSFDKKKDYTVQFFKVEIFDLEQNVISIEYEMISCPYGIQIEKSEDSAVTKFVFKNVNELENYFILS